ncbi:NAD(P)H-dependent glycerol-3-phosphate dehydrogenase [Sphaerochaeta sp. PS]|uniref:NAD(P)H-dependent glycerol-3-phosphate dehydrogenase n=1 Tax=Sphaerochaeta sp. PS TaxID=3076336 RepID=UPI0028A2F0C8|nr:NAD(P)H-dependent glycerol-3-phosphate dehydrogenase [Sphaerochaeta sp. PS]MDT4763083.1 NAD(P)H-dependent glycerol-3-phosphate dehydrogenase [Sphaerochaeta sp. PS]
MQHHNTIVIAGAGVFGTAMAERLSWNTRNTVILWSIEADVVEDINRNHRNSKYFPTHFLNTSIRATGDKTIFSSADCILLVIPSKAIVPFTQEIRAMTKEDCMVINLAKGMSDDGAFITEQIPFEKTASMKGPTFAIEVLHGLPSSFTFGGRREDYTAFKQAILPETGLYLDFTEDIRSVELMSILKNMYAIAIGLVSGRFNSPNVDFLIYTKAVNEMRRFLSLFECETETIFRYCGIGDLGLTSLNDLSRNRTLGLLMGKGFSMESGDKSSTVIEGSRTVRLMGEMTREKGVSEQFPLVQALYRLMYEGETINDYMNSAFS